MSAKLTPDLLAKVNDTLAQIQDITERLAPITMATSLGAEDMVLTDIIHRNQLPVEIFTLDTGRLPAETYQLLHTVQTHYGIDVTTYFPDTAAAEEFVRKHGPNAFYDSVELRKQCCHIRKVEPLQRALNNKGAWITGLRRQQSPTRQDVASLSWDDGFGLYKLNPLLEWSLEDVWGYIHHFEVPYNALHDKGYPSIGCAPCTRAITAGEDIRAGRWWWENPETKECGLHVPGKEKPSDKQQPRVA